MLILTKLQIVISSVLKDTYSSFYCKSVVFSHYEFAASQKIQSTLAASFLKAKEVYGLQQHMWEMWKICLLSRWFFKCKYFQNKQTYF